MNILERGGAVSTEPEIKDLNPKLYELSNEVLNLRGENSGEYTQVFSSGELEQMRENLPPRISKGFYSLCGERNSAIISVVDVDETSILADLIPSRRRMSVRFTNGLEVTRIEIKSRGIPRIKKEREIQKNCFSEIEDRCLSLEEGMVLESILNIVIDKSNNITYQRD